MAMAAEAVKQVEMEEKTSARNFRREEGWKLIYLCLRPLSEVELKSRENRIIDKCSGNHTHSRDQQMECETHRKIGFRIFRVCAHRND